MGRLLRDTTGQQCHETSVNKFEQQHHHQRLNNTLVDQNYRQRVSEEGEEPGAEDFEEVLVKGERKNCRAAIRNIKNIDGFEVVQQI